MRTSTLELENAGQRLRHFYVLTKPRVKSLIVFCAVIGMFLAVPQACLRRGWFCRDARDRLRRRLRRR